MMKPPSKWAGTGLRAAFLVGFLSLPLHAWQTNANPPAEQRVSRTRAADVTLQTNIRGDVTVRIDAAGAKSTDLVGIIRDTLGCDWRGPEAPTAAVEGTCRHLLRTYRGSVQDTLKLGPLATGLAKAGFSVVRFELSTQGEPAKSASSNWVEEKSTSLFSSNSTWRFQASKILPPSFRVRIGTPSNPGRVGVPLLFVLFGPPLLAFWVRRQMARKGAEPGWGMVWLNWILMGSWLYWISAIHIEDLGALAGGMTWNNSLATLAIGAVFFALPPLLATASCLLVLAPQTQPGMQSPWILTRLLRRTLLAEATFIMPLGLFLVGTTMIQSDWHTGMLAMVAAYADYRFLVWCALRADSQRMSRLDSGELHDRVLEIATGANLDAHSVSLLENRFPMEVNAFALGGGRFSFTRGLLESMPKREVDAVIAHELGHPGGQHIAFRGGLYVAYLLLIAPAINWCLAKAGLPVWTMAIPVAPLLYVLLVGQLSQRSELNADARAVAIGKDSEGTIAALARLARLTKSPVDWGGIQGSVLSHPSMQQRVLSLARRFGVEETRALDILHNPDIVTGDAASARYEVPPNSAQVNAVFSAAVKISHGYWTPWVFGGMMLALLVVLACVAASESQSGLYGPLISIVTFFAGLPVVGWLSLKFDDWWDCLFIRRIKRRIERRSPATAGIFVSLLPGDRIVPLESLYAWDLGRITMNDARLTYRGERAQFSIKRDDVRSIEMRKSSGGWCRTYAVLVRSNEGNFSLRLADRGRTRRLARQLDAQLQSWLRGETRRLTPGGAESLRPPDLPQIHPEDASRYRVAGIFVMRTLLLFLATVFLFSVSSLVERNPMFAFVPFAAPVVYLALMIPVLVSSE